MSDTGDITTDLARLRALADTLDAGVFEADRVGTVTFANRAFRDLTGLLPGAARWLDAVHDGDRSRLEREMTGCEAAAAPTEMMVRFRSADATGVHRLGRLWLQHDAEGLVGALYDVIDDRRREERSEPHVDPLTGVLTRSEVDRILGALLAEDRSGVVVYFIDLDGFKDVNDRLGHAVGDLLLVSVAQRLESQVRPGDAVVRFGGDEFLVAADGQESGDSALELARRLLDAICEPVVYRDEQIRVGASIGVVRAANHAGHGAAELIELADMAMFDAKASADRSIELASGRVRRRADRRRALDADFAEALRTDELDLVYQPIRDLRGRRWAGAEALVRWTHPVHGSVPAGEIVRLAEEAGLARDLTQWAMRTAAGTARRLRAEASSGDAVLIALNCSSRQLAVRGLTGDLLGALDEHGLERSDIQIELTETVLMDAFTDVVDTIDELAAAGIGISLDDFGTGYSSLDYLERFPIAELKLDRRFAERIERSDRMRTIVRHIARLAGDLEVLVTAEGVETTGQAAVFAGLGVDRIQGHHIGSPCAAVDVHALLTQR